jgi:type I restriction enzyme S subunit
METLNRDILRVLPIPLPPNSEQIYLKHKIMLYLQVIRDLDIILEQNTKNARLFRQSVLKTAFEGKLVSKDPNDEPSEILLQRIKQERLKFKSDLNKKNNN